MSTQQQQLHMHNKQQKRSKSDGAKAQKKRQCIYRGVRRRKQGRWVSDIRMPDRRGRIWLGSYDSAYKAALAYDFAAFCLRGRRSQLNFPNSLPYLALELGIPTSPRSIQAAASQFAEEHSSSSGYGVGSEPGAAVAVERQKMLVQPRYQKDAIAWVLRRLAIRVGSRCQRWTWILVFLTVFLSSWPLIPTPIGGLFDSLLKFIKLGIRAVSECF